MIDDLVSELTRYRLIGEKALAQIPDAALNHVPAPNGNSAAMIVRHMSGNLISRFTNFLTDDGEKLNRDRDREFDDTTYSRADMDALWRSAWAVFDRELGALGDADLARTVTIRQQPISVHAALCRAVAHIAYHVGQLVLLARMTADGEWKWISIPKGQSQSYNAAPDLEKRPR